MNKLLRRKIAKFWGNPAFSSTMKCPGCESNIILLNTHHINANIESDSVIRARMDFFQMVNKCENALCKWSGIKYEEI